MECGNREEARRGEITETVAIPQLKRIDGQTASSFLLLTFLLRKENWIEFEVQASAQVRKVRPIEKVIEIMVFNRTIVIYYLIGNP